MKYSMPFLPVFNCLLQSAHIHVCCIGDTILPSRPLPSTSPFAFNHSQHSTVESFRCLGTNISQDLKWDNHIDSIVKKAQQRLYFLHQLRKFNLPQELQKQFYSAIIESVMCSSITVWFGSATSKQTSEDYNGQSGLLRGLSRSLYLQSEEKG